MEVRETKDISFILCDDSSSDFSQILQVEQVYFGPILQDLLIPWPSSETLRFFSEVYIIR